MCVCVCAYLNKQHYTSGQNHKSRPNAVCVVVLQPIQECKLHYLRPSRMRWKGLKNLSCLYSHPSFNTIKGYLICYLMHNTPNSQFCSITYFVCDETEDIETVHRTCECVKLSKMLQMSWENWCRFRTLLHDPMCNSLLSWIWTLILMELWWHFFPQTVFPQSI